MSYTVSRQKQWPNGDPVVEVSEGGIDYCNPDALVSAYEGEFQEYRDPREAVKVAINICRAWRKDGEKKASVGVGCTGGMTMPFEMCSFKNAEAWAKERWKELEKCPVCGEIVEEMKEWYEAGEWFGNEFIPFGDGAKYCSEYCAEKDSKIIEPE